MKINNLSLKIVSYKNQFKESIIQALIELQEYEYSLSDTRKPASKEICSDYLKSLVNEIKIQERKILIATLSDEFVGFISYIPQSENTVFEVYNSNNYILISDICVLKDYRKIGIAQSLFEAVIVKLKNEKFKGRIRICSLSDNILALKVYKKQGFKPYEIIYEKVIN